RPPRPPLFPYTTLFRSYPSAVQTIGDQLDATNRSNGHVAWRMYAEDMGNDPVRDGGTPDPLGGTDCAHPAQTNGVGVDNTNSARSEEHTSELQSLAYLV